MQTDFIYLRGVKARIRRRDKVEHVIYFLWNSVYAWAQERKCEHKRGERRR